MAGSFGARPKEGEDRVCGFAKRLVSHHSSDTGLCPTTALSGRRRRILEGNMRRPGLFFFSLAHPSSFCRHSLTGACSLLVSCTVPMSEDTIIVKWRIVVTIAPFGLGVLQRFWVDMVLYYGHSPAT